MRASADGALPQVLIAVGVSSVGLVVAFALVWWQVIAQPHAAQLDQVKQQMAQHYSGYFNGRIAELRAQVDAMATSAATIEAVASYDDGAMRAAGERLAAENPHILRVDVIPKGKAEVDLNAEIPISFAALDLIRRAETREFVGPEVSLNQRNLIYAAQPITPQGVVAGVLLAVYTSDFFLTPLNQHDARTTSLRIEQQFAGNPRTVVMHWGASEGDGAPLVAELVTPHWTLSYGAKESLLAPTADVMSLAVPLTVAWAVMLGAVFLGFSRFDRLVKEDAAELSEFATRILRGRAARLTSYHLKALGDVATAISQYGKGAVAEPEQPEDGEDLPDDADEAAPAADAAAKKSPDDDFLEVRRAIPDDNFGIEVTEEEPDGAADGAPVDLDPDVFRAYDIRGVTTTNLTEEVVYWIGRAFAAEASAQGQSRVAVGRDGRHSSEALEQSLTRGLTEGGADVVSVGLVPTPLLYYATFALDTGTGIMITGSHNPPEYNGLKMMIDGVTLAEDAIQALRERIESGRLPEAAEPGDVEQIDLADSYIDRVLEDVAVAQSLKVVVDCGNGVAGRIAPRLLSELGCEVVPLYCDVDGDFPNHHPDPAEPENLEDLRTVVEAEGADIGLAFDGDGDRLGVVTASGRIVWPDRLLMLFGRDVVSRNPGADILYDVKCSRHLNALISEHGGRPIMWKTGHSHMKAKLKETGALLAGEFSGHICFAERWYGFDDALYSAARLLEILGSESRSPDEVFAEFPETVMTPEIKIETTDEKKFDVVERLTIEGDFGDGTVTTIDGIRVDYADGWGLIRASNTSPVLSLRFEADSEAALERIQDLFQAQLAAVDASLRFRG